MANNTIFFTPTNEQLIQIAKENPQLNEQIKESILEELKKNALKYTKNRVESNASSMFNQLYSRVESKYYVAGDSWRGTPSSFSKTVEAQLTEKIESKINEQLQTEFASYVESAEFNTLVKAKVKERLLTAVLNSLDEQIQKEAKKLTA